MKDFVEMKIDGSSFRVYRGSSLLENFDDMSEKELKRASKEIQNRLHRVVPTIIYDYIRETATATRPTTIKEIVTMLDTDYAVDARQQSIGSIIEQLEDAEIFGISAVQFKGIFYDKNNDIFGKKFKKY